MTLNVRVKQDSIFPYTLDRTYTNRYRRAAHSYSVKRPGKAFILPEFVIALRN